MAMAITPALAGDNEDRSLNVCNNTAVRISHVYVIVGGRQSFDLLNGVIHPGSCRPIDPGFVGGACEMQWRAVDHYGLEARRTIDACNSSTWQINQVSAAR